MSGYSGTPLAKKLGIKPGFSVRLINQPVNYYELFEDWPEGVQIIDDSDSSVNLVHWFVNNALELQEQMPLIRKGIVSNGMIWVSWYKKASKMPTEITEDFIRQMALLNDLVDVKVCSVDDQWSGLKLVIPIKSRT